jgi:hypothetical protein
MLTRRQFLAGLGALVVSLAGADMLAMRLQRTGGYPAGAPPYDASWTRSGSNTARRGRT